MRRLTLSVSCPILAIAVGLLLSGPGRSDPTPGKASLGKTLADFTLKDAAGMAHSLHDYKDKKAVVVLFLGTECPVNNAYAPRLAALSNAYAARDVQFLAINSNQQDTVERIADHAK